MGTSKGLTFYMFKLNIYLKQNFELKESILMNQVSTKSATEIEIINCLDASFPHFFAIPGIEQRLGSWHAVNCYSCANRMAVFMLVSKPFSDSDFSWNPATLEHPPSLLFPCRKWAH